MKITAQIADPASVTLVITVTENVDGWRELVRGLKGASYDNWHAATFCELLTAQLRKIETSALGLSGAAPGDTMRAHLETFGEGK